MESRLNEADGSDSGSNANLVASRTDLNSFTNLEKVVVKFLGWHLEESSVVELAVTR